MLQRRPLVGLVLSATLAFHLAPAHAADSLIPPTGNLSPDYFCTWNVQGYACSYASGDAQRRAMNEANLFGHGPSQGWADLYPTVRSHLFLVLDDSWDIGLPGDAREFGSLILNAERFPSYQGTPPQRLRRLSDDVKAKGWRGLGGWICAQQAPALSVPDDAAYWTERLGWMRDAGIAYWKVDWGKKDHDAPWRERLTQLGHTIAPNLIIEHALTEGALRSADVYRTYDVENVISAPVTIDRVAHLLRVAPKDSPTIANCEDEPYVAAGLGCAIGVMRHPFAGNLPNGHPDFVFPAAARDLKHRLDEVTRAVNWHRIAKPLPLGSPDNQIDPQTLSDSWTLQADETYTSHKPGDRREGKAPARISRGGLPLPTVETGSGQPAPFVLTTRSPNGPVAIATIGRTLDRAYVTSKARVTQDVGPASTIGLFGTFAQLTLRFDAPLDHRRVLAQDLAGREPVDITDRVTTDGRSLTLEGDLISQLGLSAATNGDVSEPGLVLTIR